MRYTHICQATTLKGSRCKKNRINDTCFCRVHTVETCSICLKDLAWGQGKKLKDCGHQFCNNCVNHWLVENPSCPNCRSGINYYDQFSAELYGKRHKMLMDFTIREYDFSGLPKEDLVCMIQTVSCFTEAHFPVTYLEMAHYDSVMGLIAINPGLTDFLAKIPTTEKKSVIKTKHDLPPFVNTFRFFK